MTTKTRNFVVASLLVLCTGLGIGFLSYFARSTSALAAPGPEEMRFVPGDATMVAFANVQQVMTSELRQRVRNELGTDGSRSFQLETGINPETDVDRVVLGSLPGPSGGPKVEGSSVFIVRGRFDAVKIERALRDRGARVDDYKGIRIVTRPARTDGTVPGSPTSAGPGADALALAFVEAGLIVVGEAEGVRRAIDVGRGGGSALTNTELINRVRSLDGNSLWAVGRFDALPASTPFAQGIVDQLPPISWFAASGQIDSGVKAQFTAETRDEASANNLRDLVRGFMAIGRLQAGSRPELQPAWQSVQIGGAGQLVTLSIDLSPQVLDILSSGLRPPAVSPGTRPRR